MKLILLFTCVLTLLSTTGCLTSHKEWLGHTRNERLVECIAGPPTVEVYGPAAGGHPPEIIGR